MLKSIVFLFRTIDLTRPVLWRRMKSLSEESLKLSGRQREENESLLKMWNSAARIGSASICRLEELLASVTASACHRCGGGIVFSAFGALGAIEVLECASNL